MLWYAVFNLQRSNNSSHCRIDGQLVAVHAALTRHARQQGDNAQAGILLAETAADDITEACPACEGSTEHSKEESSAVLALPTTTAGTDNSQPPLPLLALADSVLVLTACCTVSEGDMVSLLSSCRELRRCLCLNALVHTPTRNRQRPRVRNAFASHS